jgi:hypothetical protein
MTPPDAFAYELVRDVWLAQAMKCPDMDYAIGWCFTKNKAILFLVATLRSAKGTMSFELIKKSRLLSGRCARMKTLHAESEVHGGVSGESGELGPDFA